MDNDKYIIKYSKGTPFVYLGLSVVFLLIYLQKNIRGNINASPISIILLVLIILSLFDCIKIILAHRVYLVITKDSLYFPTKKLFILKQDIIDMKIVYKNTSVNEFSDFSPFLKIKYKTHILGISLNRKILIGEHMCDIKLTELKKIIRGR